MITNKTMRIRLVAFLLAAFLVVGGAFAILAVRSYRAMNREIYNRMEERDNKYITLNHMISDLAEADGVLENADEETNIYMSYDVINEYEKSIRGAFSIHLGSSIAYVPNLVSVEEFDQALLARDFDEEISSLGGAVFQSHSSILYDNDGDLLYVTENRSDYISKLLYYDEVDLYYDSSETPEKYSYIHGTPVTSDLYEQLETMAEEIIEEGTTHGIKNGYAYYYEEWDYEYNENIYHTVFFVDVTEEHEAWKKDVGWFGMILFFTYILIAVVAILHYSRVKKPETEPETVKDESTGKSVLREKFEAADLLSKVENAERSIAFSEDMNKLRELVDSVQNGTSPEVHDEE